MNPYIEETIVVFFVIFALPAYIYALEKIRKKRMFNKTLVTLLYIIIFYNYISNLEKIKRGIEDDYRPFAPKFLINFYVNHSQLNHPGHPVKTPRTPPDAYRKSQKTIEGNTLP